MKNKRKETLFIIFAFVFMTAAKAFGNLYVAAFGVAFGLSVGLAFVTAMIGDSVRKRKERGDV
ncbi:hypothetical protein CN324_09845 [Bacillus anthracis]|uniref:Uncharacterized protein n=1 Tax=Bacillus tropicus TaxID=2026188 RepID=A0ABD8A086_9BACI|nr:MULTISPECIES: hypothetical protein [Bacillus]AIY75786.1 putative membrane protein [Bacillus cereus]AJI03953.1 putative membrane protein [Bacillus cereus G9241]PED55758.1 hypothetical protein CON50_10610 [Bacillus anthracis]AJG91856.1 putative membrane protein [Bacillus cereus]ARO18668.1 hypothetical protein B2J90_14785 [Bacillus cereus]